MPAPPPVVALMALMALREWSTDSTPAPERLGYWVGAICEAFLEMDGSPREARVFDGHLKNIGVGSLAFNQVQATTHDVCRTQAAIARST